MAAACLLEQGHRRIALLSAPLEMNFARQRKDSFVASMSAAGLAVDPRHLVDSQLDRRSGYQAMQQLLACSPRPSAVIVDNNIAGIGAVHALRDAGVEMGKDMSIIVWGSMADTLAGANVTTIDQPQPIKAGARMIEMLLALIDGTPASELHELWQPVFLAGTTVGPCPAT